MKRKFLLRSGRTHKSLRASAAHIVQATLVFFWLFSNLSFAEQPIVLKGGKLLTVSHGVIENGVLVMQDGKISEVGTASSVKVPRAAKVIDVTGMTIYPGLFDS